MKKLLLVLILLVSAGSLFAAELKVTGDAFTRGQIENNIGLVEKDAREASYYDYELNLNLAFVANENATVFTRLVYDKKVDGSGKVALSDADDTTADQLSVERAYLNYKFHPALQLEAGLMGGGQWASTFGDTEINVMRLKLIGALSEDMVFLAIVQKDNEVGASAGSAIDPADEDKEDSDTYYLASRMKFGPVTVLPLLVYNTTGYDYDGTTFETIAGFGQDVEESYDFTTMAFDLGLNGDFGMVGFKSEFIYKKFDTGGLQDDMEDVSTLVIPVGHALRGVTDTTTYGAYVDVFAKVAPATVGFVYAYASADEEDGVFNWGEDFDVCVVMDDYIGQGSNNLMGWSVYKLYADATMEKISANIAIAYGATNKDYVDTDDKDATFTEIDLGASYAFDANATYSVSAGYAMTKDVVAGVDAKAYVVSHKFSVKF